LPEAIVGTGKTVSRALADATVALTAAGCDTPRLDAELLLSYVLGVGRERLVTDAFSELDASQLERFAAVLARREAREPVAYIIGRKAFRRIAVAVDRRVLIPRPETEQVVEVALAEGRRLHQLADSDPGRDTRGDRGLVVVDAGTGCGAIALALASELGPCLLREVWATDVSADALEVAGANVEAKRASRCGRSLPAIELVEGSWLEALPARVRGAVDLVVANPPYVSAGEWAGLASEVRAEPRRALVAGPASDGTPGLADVEALLEECLVWLGRPGSAVMELAPHQAEPAARLARGVGYDEVRVEPRGGRAPWSYGPAADGGWDS
jgi:release factor glutamine methyltransferase